MSNPETFFFCSKQPFSKFNILLTQENVENYRQRSLSCCWFSKLLSQSTIDQKNHRQIKCNSPAILYLIGQAT